MTPMCGFLGGHRRPRPEGISQWRVAQWRFRELSSGPLEEQALLAAGPGLQLPYFILIDNFNVWLWNIILSLNICVITFFFIFIYSVSVHSSGKAHLWSLENNFQEFSPSTTWVLGLKLCSYKQPTKLSCWPWRHHFYHQHQWVDFIFHKENF